MTEVRLVMRVLKAPGEGDFNCAFGEINYFISFPNFFIR
jgi:hypothetical protein